MRLVLAHGGTEAPDGGQHRGTAGVEVTQTADNQLKLNILSDISFASGRSDIQPTSARSWTTSHAACRATRTPA